MQLAQEGLLEESVEELYDNAPCGYYSTLPDGTFIKVNHTFLNWLGYERADLLYIKKIQDLLLVGDAIFYETHYYPLLQMQGFVNEINFALRCQNGNMLPVLLNTTLVRDTKGRPAMYRTTVFDITDRKKYELELLKAKQKAEKAARVKAEFLSTVSHEVRTPINAIVGIVHLLRNTGLTPQQAEYLSILELSTENLLKLINNILDFSKIEAGKVSLEEEVVNIRELVGSVVMGFEPKAEEKGLTLQAMIGEDVPPLLHVDSLKLVQVLNNLISNAIKFTEQGSIKVKLRLKEQHAHRASLLFKVVDTGMGIPSDKLEKVFEEFEQADANISRTHGGTGLGLAISQRLLGLYGSKLQVESEPGKGSCFYFSLNLKIGEATPDVNRQQDEPKSARGVRLLLVEDNKINIYVLSQYLTNWGVRFDVVGNGQQALEMVSEHNYDLVLMDLQMPVMDGYEASRRIREMEGGKFHNLPIIALTASARSDYERKLAASGINGILAKPFNPNTLYKLIASHSRAPSAAQEGEQVLPQPSEGSTSSFDLSSINDLMSDDPKGMLDLIQITIGTLNEADRAVATAMKNQDQEQYALWVQNIETCLVLLQAKQLLACLEHGLELLRSPHVAPEQLELEEHLIGTHFRIVLNGLDERLKLLAS
ncbi:PAS domain-containing hybrid sensor histidine kinase/response regulator [Pontibacter litorisediminis]|uniref:PAS domain-containing hybrid sensor histidine kinase/response regulator n=1 Tax=Pontibacter litorisediminis TaxID=1846260 RepID=UPI0023ECCAFB|nr:PAS domain-containing hybrid sensor histidine kinase/response regulator [Pontibacter litorisediminis]